MRPPKVEFLLYVKQFLTDISVTVALHEKLKSLDPDNLSIFGPDGSPPNSRYAFSAISWGVICFFLANMSVVVTSKVEENRP